MLTYVILTIITYITGISYSLSVLLLLFYVRTQFIQILLIIIIILIVCCFSYFFTYYYV